MSGAITAVGVAIAAATVTEIFTAVAITGAVLGAVGAVTGVKPLMYAGMALGVVGGVGAFASGLGMGAELGVDAFGEGAMDGASAAEGGVLSEDGGGFAAGGLDGITPAAPGMDLQGAPITYAAEGAQATPTSVIDTITGQMSGIDPASAALPTGAESPGVLPSAATDSSVIPQGNGVSATESATQGNPEIQLAETPVAAPQGGTPPPGTPPPTPAPPSTPAPPDWQGNPATWDPTMKQVLGVSGGPTIIDPVGPGLPGTGVPISGPGAPSSAWGSIMKFATSPGGGLLGLGALQAGASFLSGATSTLTPAQVELYKAQAANNLAAANLANANLANMGQPLPVATRPGAAPAGLINRTPVPVTGAPA